MQKKWRLIPTIKAPGKSQMAIDEAILNARVANEIPNTIRFYEWNPACITIGFFQELTREVNIEKAKELGIDIIRRYTGGGAILHDKEITYSIIASEKDISKNILESYEIICGAIVKGLNNLGIKADFKAINDICVNNKKISGSAQTRKNGVILQHGTIIIDADIKKMFSVLKVPDEKIKHKLIKTAEERVTSINKLTNKNITFDRIKNMLKKGFEETFNIKLKESKLISIEEKNARELEQKKYSNDRWNYERELRQK